ncbi:ISL3 family transposase [Arthrobacter sp. LAR12-1-1.1]|uniref:ISL3 family transposase n=1 Tax=Arthrobacter sp. LAR12-1-1.1 TaxID=3135215 RepID=UPI0034238467
MTEPTVVAFDAATSIFNLPDYRVISATALADGRRQIIVETDQPPGCPSCGVVATRRKERRFQRIRDIPVAGAVEVLWSKYRWHCEEPRCSRLSFFESTAQVPRRARSTGRLRDHVVDAVINSGRAVSETAAAFAVSWWTVRAALTEACLLTLPDVDELRPRMLGIDEHRFRSVRYFRDPHSSSWVRHEPWMTTIVDLDTGQVLGVVDGRDHRGVGDWLFARPLQWRLGVQVVAIDPSAAFRKALRMWLPRTAVAVDHFHLVALANQAMTEARQNLSQQVKGRRGRGVDKAWAHRMLLLRAGDTLSGQAARRLAAFFAAYDATGKLQAVWKVKEQVRALLHTSSLQDAAAAKEELKILVDAAARPETNKLYRTVCRWWNEIEVLNVTGATTAPRHRQGREKSPSLSASQRRLIDRASGPHK